MKQWLAKMAIVLGATAAFLLGMEWYAVRYEESGFHKRVRWFRAHGAEAEGLIFGPSLLVQGIDPAGFEMPVVSLALSASAPDVDVRLLRRALDVADPEFVLFDLTTGTLDRRKPAKYYSQRKLYYYLGIDHEDWELRDMFFSSYPHYRYFYRTPSRRKFDERGFATVVPPDEDYMRLLGYDKDSIAAEKRLMRKMRKQHLYSDYDNQLNRQELKAVIELCRERGIKFIFLSPPKYELFNENIQDLHRDRRNAFLQEVVDGRTVFFWDYGFFGQDDPRNFHNINHLSPVGAQKFTAALNARILAEDW